MKSLFLALQDKILSVPAVSPDEVSPAWFKHVDRYNAQPEFTEGVIPFHLPAIFVEFADIPWEDLTGGVQRGKALLRFHVLQYSLGDSSADVFGQEGEEKTEALRLFDTLEALHGALQGLAGQSEDELFSWTGLRRVRTRSDTRHNILSLDILEYTTTLTDSTAAEAKGQIVAALPNPDISGEPVPELPPPLPYSPVGANGFRL